MTYWWSQEVRGTERHDAPTACLGRTKRIPTSSSLYIFNAIPCAQGRGGEDREGRALPKHKGERTGTGIRANSPKLFTLCGGHRPERWWVSLTSSKPSRGCVSVVEVLTLQAVSGQGRWEPCCLGMLQCQSLCTGEPTVANGGWS